MNLHRPQISIALASYNGERYISEQLHSLVQQSYPPTEIVICDDGSMDGTLQCIQDFQERHAGIIRLYRNDSRLGYAKNFEKAISLCRGEVIALCDQDDVWLPHKIAQMVEALYTSSRCGLVVANAEVVGANLEPRGRLLYSEQRICLLRSPDAIFELLHGVGINGCTMAFRSCDVPYLLPLVTTAWGHDHWIALLFAATGRIAVIEEPTMLYRRHGNSGGSNPALQQNWFRRMRQTIQMKLRHTSVQAYELHAEKWKLLEQRIQAICSSRSDLNRDRVEGIIVHIRKWHEFTAQRLSVRRQRRYARLAPAIALWRSGGYRSYANGVGALLKDMLV